MKTPLTLECCRMIALFWVIAIRADARVTVRAPTTGGSGTTAPTTAPTTREAASPLVWIDSPEKAYDDAQRLGRPILVHAGTSWSKASRALTDTLQSPPLVEKLKAWTLVYVDAEKDASAARSLGVTRVPSLRVLTSSGHVVAAHDGPFAAADLSSWIDASFIKSGGGRSRDYLLGDGAPDAATIDRAISDLVGGDPLLSEAAIRRLAPYPAASAARVTDAFIRGNLSSRLATLELLKQWRAPIEGVDPWEAATITKERIDALKRWSADASKRDSAGGAPPASAPAAEDLAEARREIRLMLESTSDAEARVIRERVARLGEALLPEVYAQLKTASTTDQVRQRLTALRYRLAATDRLALSWPDGFERLASTETSIRHTAIDELSKRASPADSRLLLELFGDADPLVREMSLRVLRGVGGEPSAKALGGLLDDPNPNVRAAVLKQLSENPQDDLIGRVVQYVGREQDSDLVVHAVRVLRAGGPTDESLDCLKRLLGHESWRVRAEAIDAIHEKIGRSSDAVSTERKANLYTAMIKLLDDPDGFVVSRAVTALADAHLATAVDPMLRAAEKHVELSAEIVKTLGNDQTLAQTALPQLRKLVGHDRPAVRAAAISAVCAAQTPTSSAELHMALGDRETSVRAAAARALVAALQKLRPQDGYITRSSFFGFDSKREKVDENQWLEEFRKGKGRPIWTKDLVADLKKCLAADDVTERVAAGIALASIAHEHEALPVLSSAFEKQTGLRTTIAGALQWLPSAKRIALFEKLVAPPVPEQERAGVIEQMAQVPDPAAAESIWKLLAEKDATVRTLDAAHSALQEMYLGTNYYNLSDVAPARKKAAIETAAQKAAGGPEFQRTAALCVLLIASPADAVKAAAPILQDARSSEWQRLDALQITLLAQDKDEAQQTAAKYVADPVLYKIAVPFLAIGPDSCRMLRGSVYVYYNNNSWSRGVTYGEGSLVKVEPPKGLEPAAIVPLLKHADESMRGYAGYLLALLGDRQGIEALLTYWRNNARDDENWKRMVYRAITALNDDALTPVLDELYQHEEKNGYQLRDFYWTIRSIKGPNALKLRKKIRDEIGMEQLR